MNPTCLLNGSEFYNSNMTCLLNGPVVLTCLLNVKVKDDGDDATVMKVKDDGD